jgi:UDP-N-acetylmuramoylalanine--D-glutamate ligase
MLELSLLQKKDIVILGAGLTGLSCARFLHNNGIKFSMNDSRSNAISLDKFNEMFDGNYLALGHWDKSLINGADILIVSPGIDLSTPEIALSLNEEGEVYGDVELFCRVTDIPTIAVTGSNGKSTVVTLLAYLGNALGYKTQLGGNIGVPVLDTVDEKPDFLVLELSSFQLETMTNMKALSASVLNVSDDHLDRHKTIENYQAIKQDIYRQSDIAVINRDDERTHLPDMLRHKIMYSFGSDKPVANDETCFGLAKYNDKQYLMSGNKPLISVDDLPLAGIHNALNCLAALALGKAAGWSVTKMVAALPGFVGLAHRCQPVASTDGILWVNDSKATNIGATLAAINGFSANKKTASRLFLIAGGDGKGADFSELKPAIEQEITQLVTLGKDGPELAKLQKNSIQVKSLKEAVTVIQQQAQAGDIVLLSPACASIDMFKNYIARGLAFEQAVQEVQAC